MDQKRLEFLYGHEFINYVGSNLLRNEQLIDAVPTISERIAAFSRSDREGTLGLTNFRLIFVAKHSGHDWTLNLFEIDSVTTGKAGLIGQKFLTLHYGDSLRAHYREPYTRFMIGKKQAELFVPALENALRTARAVD